MISLTAFRCLFLAIVMIASVQIHFITVAVLS